MENWKKQFRQGGVAKRALSLVMVFAMMLSLLSGLGTIPKASAADTQIRLTDLVQIKLGDQVQTMDLYRNGVYETCVIASSKDHTATLLINGEETDQSVELSLGSAIILRVQDGKLSIAPYETAALVGNFHGLEFVDEDDVRFDIASWNPADENAELTYVGGGLFARTFHFKALTEDIDIADGGYKVAFNDSWDKSIGLDGGNIALTVPAGTDHLTVLVDALNNVVYDSVRSGSFSVAQNGGAVEKPALDTVVSFIGDARGLGGDDWNAGLKGFEFTQISDKLFRYQKTFAPGTYNYKCVFDYANWYEAEAGNRTIVLTEETNVVFLYDAESGKLYDTVNNTNTVGEMLGMQAPPAEMKVINNANGTTTFVATGEDGKAVSLHYCDKATPDKEAVVSLGKFVNGSASSDAIYFGDAALDILYWYEIDGVRTLDGSNPTVSVNGKDYSNYTREAFTGRLITVPGTFPGPSWDAASNPMTYEGNGRYIYTFKDVPAANYQYKIATGTWGENYGAGGVVDGPNIMVTVTESCDVSIYYNDFSHYAACSVDYILADVTLRGTGIAEGTKLTDDALIGIYSVTVAMKAGTYTDIAIEYNGGIFAFESVEVSEDKDVTFYFDPATGIFYCNASNVALETEHIYFNSKDAAYKSVYGAVATGEEVTFGIDTGVDATSVTLIVKGTNARSLAMERSGEAVDDVQKWAVTTSFDKIGENSFYFAISNGSSVKIYADDDGYYGEGKVTELTDIVPYDLIVYKAGFETPDWMKNAVIYQIFPDRFFDGAECNNLAQEHARGEVNYEYIRDWYTLPENPEQEALLSKEDYLATGAHYGDGEWSNEIYGGDLQGIIDRIDYLKALGVNVIYLNPVFSSISSHRYDACDYKEIDPILGTLGSFQELVRIAEENDMHIILDGVFNHVSDDSIYFDRYYRFLGTSEKIGAYPYWAYVYDYMTENSVDQAAAEAAAKEYFGEEYGITDYSYTEWFEVLNTPLVDKDTEEFVVDTIGLRAGKTVYGYEGWWGYDSMPVILSTNGSEYQTGNWAQEIIYNEEETSVAQYWINQGSDGWRLDVANEVSDETWQEFRKSVKALNSDAVIIGEIWTDAVEYLLGDMYDSVMNYMFRNAVTSFAMGGTAQDATNTLERLRERYPEEAFYAMMNLVGSHDTSRILSYLDGIGDDRTDKTVDGAFPTYEKTSDLAKQRQYLVAFLQFTYAGAPTIYYGDEIGMTGADDPDDRRGFTWGNGNEELVTWYAKMAKIRELYPTLRTGSVEPFAVNDDTMAYIRRDDANAVVVLASKAQEEQKITLNLADLDVNATEITDVVSGATYSAGEDGTITVTVPALRGVILMDSTHVAEGLVVDVENLKPAFDPSYIVETRGESAEHNFSGWYVSQAPTCTVEGIEARFCLNCLMKETRPIDTTACASDKFSDIGEVGTWYHDSVDLAVKNGWMIGVGGDKFGVSNTMTRAQFVTILHRMIGTPVVEGAKNQFTDVPANTWYTNAVIWAAASGIVKGSSATTFSPNAPITREQVAVLLFRYSHDEKLEEDHLTDFSDKTSVHSWAADGMNWAVGSELLKGQNVNGSVLLKPLAEITRAETAVMFVRFDAFMAKRPR